MLISFEECCFDLDCGNYKDHTVDAVESAQEILGTVKLERGQNYLNCREKCFQSYPDFQFFIQKDGERLSCTCLRLTDGSELVKKRSQRGQVFGYADSCSK